MEDLAGEVAGAGAEEEEDGIHDVRGFGDPAERDGPLVGRAVEAPAGGRALSREAGRSSAIGRQSPPPSADTSTRPIPPAAPTTAMRAPGGGPIRPAADGEVCAAVTRRHPGAGPGPAGSGS